MRRGLYCGLTLLIAAGGTFVAATAQPPQPVVPARHAEPAQPARTRDLDKLTPAQQSYYRSALRGMDWLRRTNKPDGKFVYGFLPALRTPLEGDNYVDQAGAAFALARAGRYFGDEAPLAIARQALLTLLLETSADPLDPTCRATAAPPQVLNRLASHGALVLAVHELPAPGQDLIDQADQLCNHLRKQQQADGSLVSVEGGEDAKSAARDGTVQCAGLALWGVVHSQPHRPAPWKLEMLAKARAYYQGCWARQKSLPLATSHTPAYAEAYLLTKDRAFAELVFAMNDWLCAQQYTPADQHRPHWVGGFPGWADGKAILSAPDVRSAAAAESLAEACRVARAAGDASRLRRYEQALESCLQFLLGLQYDEARTQHYVEPFRPALLGAFYASPHDGNLRIDYTQHAVSALVRHLQQVAE